MQVSKAKKGYKFVDTGFGKEIEIPEEWEIKNFEEFVSVKHGFGFESNDFVDSDGIKIIKIGDIKKDGSVNTENLDKISIEIAKENEEVSISDGDILMALTGATLGKTGIIKTNEKILQNQRVGNIFPIDEKILDKKFLFFILTSDFIQNQVWSFVSSSAQPNIGKSELNKIKFFKPQNLNEQQKITSIISNVDGTLEKTKELIQKTKLLKKGLMQKLLTKGIKHVKFKKVNWLFGKIIEIPEEWEIFELDELSEKITDGEHSTPIRQDKGIMLLSARNIKNGFIDLDQKIDYVSKQEFERIKKRCEPKFGDVLISCSGTVGRVTSVKIKEAFGLVRSVALIKTKNDLIKSNFLEYCLQGNISQKQIKINQHESSQANLFQNEIKKIKIILPSVNEQKQIASILSNVDSQITKEKLNKVNLELLKKGLMQKLLTGQIRVKV